MGGASYQLLLQHGLLSVSNPVYFNIYAITLVEFDSLNSNLFACPPAGLTVTQFPVYSLSPSNGSSALSPHNWNADGDSIKQMSMGKHIKHRLTETYAYS